VNLQVSYIPPPIGKPYGESNVAGDLLIPLVAGIIGLGVLGQVLAARLRDPSIIFFLLVGLIIGRPGFGIVTNASFGDALQQLSASQLRSSCLREPSTWSLSGFKQRHVRLSALLR